MTQRLCLRCDWIGEAEEPACPRCGAPLYRMDSRPTPPRPVRAPDRSEPPSEVPSPRRSTRDATNEDALVPATTAERGRWRIILLAVVITAAVGFGLTRGGEPDPQRALAGEERARPDPPGGSPTSTPAPSRGVCSGDPTPPELAAPVDSVPAPTADYLFQDSLASSLGTAPDLVEVEDGSTVFTVDTTTGITVLRFAGGQGLALDPTIRVVPSSVYTIELLFRFDLLSGYRKIIDFQGGSGDDGLYLSDGCLTFFPKVRDASTKILTDSYVQVVLTRDSTDRVVAYVDGVRQFAFDDRAGLARIAESKTLRFFVDDDTTTGEFSSGAVSQIRLFDQPLTENEVAALACTEFVIADVTLACREIPQ